MKRLLLLIFCLALALPAVAQPTAESLASERPRPQGYTFFGGSNTVGDSDKLMAVGVGGEGFVYKGLAAGGEAGYLFPAEQFVYGIGLVSADASYHFQGLGHDSRWVPFVTGGYSVAFRGDAANRVNYGGGVTYWFHPHLGVRFEVRNHQDSRNSLLTYRVAFSFR